MNVLGKIEVTIFKCAQYPDMEMGCPDSEAAAASGHLFVSLTLSGHYLGFLLVQLHLRSQLISCYSKVEGECCIQAESGGQGETEEEEVQRWPSGGWFQEFSKISSGHRATKSKLHKAGSWHRRDKEDFTNKDQPRPQPAKVCLLFLGPPL